jgi:hypothetical protein
MKSKLIIAIMCIVALLASSGCIAAKTVTQTVAATTVTQWTASTTVTQTVPSVSLVTIPAVTNIVTQAPVTTTVTAPPLTSTVIQPMVTTVTSPPITNTVTSPPVTSTVTTPPVTTTVTYTPTVTLTAKEAIEVTIQPLGGINPILVTGASPQSYYLTLSYNNTQDKAYSNVKFKLTVYNSGFTTVVSQTITPIAPVTPLWVSIPSITPTIFYYQTLSGITVNANSSGELILQITVTYIGTGSVFPIVEII